MHEILVGGEERQIVAKAERRKESIDRSHLDPLSSAGMEEIGSFCVIVPGRSENRECHKSLTQGLSLARPRQSLKELLEHQTRRDDELPFAKKTAELDRFGYEGGMIPTEGERPDTRVDEHAQPRVRSAL